MQPMEPWFGVHPVTAIGFLMLLAISAYLVLGGADFGGGIWDLLARGPRREQQRVVIAKAMGPVWEANHVWLIFLVVILFTVFPPAFRALSLAFFGLFHWVLVGIVLRGAAFIFRTTSDTASTTWRVWTPVFGASSAITPFLLGMAIAAISGGGIRVLPSGEVQVDPALTWYSPVSILMGLLTVALCAYLAAVFLTVETKGEMQEDFRTRSLWAGGVMAGLAVALLIALPGSMPHLWEHMTLPASLPPLAFGGVLALLSLWAVVSRSFKLARFSAVAQVIVLLGGWAFGQWPYLIYPDVTVAEAASPEATIRFLLNTLPIGMSLLLPSLWYLFKVFKTEQPETK